VAAGAWACSAGIDVSCRTGPLRVERSLRDLYTSWWGDCALVYEGVYEAGAVEGDDVFELFADPGVDDREFEFRGDG
jgi:hypothetical protein